jgi:antitoxin Phd
MGARRRQPVSVRDETRSVPGQAERITVAATDAQNEFGRILEHAVQDRVVVITRHNAPRAVLMSFDRYTALTAAGATVLDTLTEEFDRLPDRLQAPGAQAGMRRAFAASPAELGQAAVAAATGRVSDG